MNRTPIAATRRTPYLAALALAAWWLCGCAAAPPATSSAVELPDGSLRLEHWRSVGGGFLAAPAPGTGFGVAPRPSGGAFVKLVAPTVLALAGNDLLIVDSGTARIWRVDLGLNTFTPIANPSAAPATPGTALAIGPDLSAWVLDGVSRQVTRFARDGRPMQTYRAGNTAPAPVGIALADGGATLLMADAALRHWLEFRPIGSFSTAVVPDAVRSLAGAAGAVRGVDAIATSRDSVVVLDRSAGAVHVMHRDGQIQGRLGEGDLKQPVALAADRYGRVFVLDAQDDALVLLRVGRAAQRITAQALRVQRIGGIAVDESLLAVSDPLTGQVVLHVVRDLERP